MQLEIQNPIITEPQHKKVYNGNGMWSQICVLLSFFLRTDFVEISVDFKHTYIKTFVFKTKPVSVLTTICATIKNVNDISVSIHYDSLQTKFLRKVNVISNTHLLKKSSSITDSITLQRNKLKLRTIIKISFLILYDFSHTLLFRKVNAT